MGDALGIFVGEIDGVLKGLRGLIDGKAVGDALASVEKWMATLKGHSMD